MSVHENSSSSDLSMETIWKVISFFAADSEKQINALGESTYDFYCSDDEYFRKNENYLVGLYIVYVTLWASFREKDSSSLDEQSENFELKAQLDLMFWATEKRICNFWTRPALRDSPIWRIVRRIAGKLIADNGLSSNFPDEPLCIENIVEPPTDPEILDFL